MLVLARKRNESLMIGNEIEVRILDLKGDVVRLGISAPSSIPVYRKEIYDQILKENITAASLDISLEDIGKNISTN